MRAEQNASRQSGQGANATARVQIAAANRAAQAQQQAARLSAQAHQQAARLSAKAAQESSRAQQQAARDAARVSTQVQRDATRAQTQAQRDAARETQRQTREAQRSATETARAQERAQREAARQGERAAREAQRQSRETARVAQQAARDQARAAQRAADASVKAARDAAKAQERAAHEATRTVEREAKAQERAKLRADAELDAALRRRERERASRRAAQDRVREGQMSAGKAAGAQLADRGSAAATAGGLAIAGGFILSAREAIAWEDAFAGVVKTVSASDKELAKMSDQLRAMSTQIPTSANDLAGIAASAGQLGIKTSEITRFTRVIADLSVATNLTAEQGATDMARFANITKLPQAQFDRLGATIVDLGNKNATTEREIVSMGLRIASAGSQIGLTQSQIVGFAAALSSVGIRAEMGGTAISTIFRRIDKAVRGGGETLEAYAKVAGKSSAEFKKAFETDAAGAIKSFVSGLGEIKSSGGDLFGTFAELGMKGDRVVDTLGRMSSNSAVLNKTLGEADSAWKNNTALTEEARKRYATTASQIRIAENNFRDFGITVGTVILPAISDLLKLVKPTLDNFRSLSKEQQVGRIKMVAYAGVALLVAGRIKGIVDTVILMRTAFIGVRAAMIAAQLAGKFSAASIGASFSSLIGVAGPLALVAIAIAGFAVAFYGARDAGTMSAEALTKKWGKLGEMWVWGGDQLGKLIDKLNEAKIAAGETAEAQSKVLSNRMSAPGVQSAPKSDVWMKAHPGYGRNGQKIDGSHAGGLARVPRDGYIAELHKDERVLTAKEAKEYRAGGRNSMEAPRPQFMRSMFAKVGEATMVQCGQAISDAIGSPGFATRVAKGLAGKTVRPDRSGRLPDGAVVSQSYGGAAQHFFVVYTDRNGVQRKLESTTAGGKGRHYRSDRKITARDLGRIMRAALPSGVRDNRGQNVSYDDGPSGYQASYSEPKKPFVPSYVTAKREAQQELGARATSEKDAARLHALKLAFATKNGVGPALDEFSERLEKINSLWRDDNSPVVKLFKQKQIGSANKAFSQLMGEYDADANRKKQMQAVGDAQDARKKRGEAQAEAMKSGYDSFQSATSGARADAGELAQRGAWLLEGKSIEQINTLLEEQAKWRERVSDLRAGGYDQNGAERIANETQAIERQNRALRAQMDVEEDRARDTPQLYQDAIGKFPSMTDLVAQAMSDLGNALGSGSNDAAEIRTALDRLPPTLQNVIDNMEHGGLAADSLRAKYDGLWQMLAQAQGEIDRREAATSGEITAAADELARPFREAADRLDAMERELDIRQGNAGAYDFKKNRRREITDDLNRDGLPVDAMRVDKLVDREAWVGNVEGMMNDVRGIFSNSFGDISRGFSGMCDNILGGFNQMLQKMAAEYLANFVMQQVFGALVGSFGGGAPSMGGGTGVSLTGGGGAGSGGGTDVLP